ncbi:phosphoribosylamine--glycine ligase [Verrucomicrobiota bacterium]
MKILVIGGGGREHALIWRLANDSVKPELFCAPGNAGTAQLAVNLDIGAEDIDGLLNWARENKPDLTVIGPEAPLCAGLTNKLGAEGLRVFGPSKAAAQLEGSKVFAKDIMETGDVPTAEARSFTDYSEALEYVRSREFPIVVKAEGLAAGKGVYICESLQEAEEAINDSMQKKIFGEAGSRILVEECLEGEEASILALIDGETIVMLASSQDHKRIFDNDQGPNTGGMGAYSPAPVITDELWPIIRTQVFERTLMELRKRGIVYKGVLYAGIMVTADGPKVLEFNCRFGDPETQVILPRIESDLVPALEACIDGTLKDDLVKWRPEACTCVVMASGGYPGKYEKGKVIEGLKEADDLDDVVVFHAGTKIEKDKVVTSGGRVLGVTARGKDLAAAVEKVYSAVSRIKFDQAQYRTDIAKKAFNR